MLYKPGGLFEFELDAINKAIILIKEGKTEQVDLGNNTIVQKVPSEVPFYSYDIKITIGVSREEI